MEHYFVLNTLSFPAEDAKTAKKLLTNAVYGMLKVGIDNDRYALFSDTPPSLSKFELAPQYSYADFLDELKAEEELDLHSALLEIEDKSPALEFLEEDVFTKIANESFYFPETPYTGSIDIIALAWHLDAALLSIASSEKWQKNQIEFSIYSNEKLYVAPSFLNNISCIEHGIELGKNLRDEGRSLEDRFSSCKFSEQFLQWECDLPADLRRRIGAKFVLADAKNFQGGEPLFKTLTDAEGIRELRFSAVQGGAVRILFNLLASGKPAILTGFVKKSDDEGYKEAISAAKDILSAIKKDALQS